jgi:hypothetical protein
VLTRVIIKNKFITIKFLNLIIQLICNYNNGKKKTLCIFTTGPFKINLIN